MKRFMIDMVFVLMILVMANQINQDQTIVDEHLVIFEQQILNHEIIYDQEIEESIANQFAITSGKVVEKGVTFILKAIGDSYDLLINSIQY